MGIAVCYLEKSEIMIKKQNVTKDLVKFLDSRFAGTMFGLARFLGIYFDEIDIKYIETKMMTDRGYRLVSGKAVGKELYEMPYRSSQFCEIWLMKFLDDSAIPLGVKAFIIGYVGHKRGELKVFYGMDVYNDLAQQKFLSERWMEICH